MYSEKQQHKPKQTFFNMTLWSNSTFIRNPFFNPSKAFFKITISMKNNLFQNYSLMQH